MWNLVLRNSSYVTVSNITVINYSDPAATMARTSSYSLRLA